LREEILDFFSESKNQQDIDLKFGFNNEAVRKMIRILMHEGIVSFEQNFYTLSS
jgi:predicted transcriptional regulator